MSLEAWGAFPKSLVRSLSVVVVFVGSCGGWLVSRVIQGLIKGVCVVDDWSICTGDLITVAAQKTTS